MEFANTDPSVSLLSHLHCQQTSDPYDHGIKDADGKDVSYRRLLPLFGSVVD